MLKRFLVCGPGKQKNTEDDFNVLKLRSLRCEQTIMHRVTVLSRWEEKVEVGDVLLRE
jgi:hypothetical protein